MLSFRCHFAFCCGFGDASNAPNQRLTNTGLGKNRATVGQRPPRRVEHLAGKEVANDCRDFLRMSFKREVTRVEETNGRTGNVSFERLGTLRQEEGVVLSPCRQEARFVRPKVILESRIERDVTLVVAEHVQLNLVSAGA